MMTTVAQMTTAEFRELLEEVIEQKLLELLADPDQDQFWKHPPPVPRSLKGIWKHQGFERIHDLEGELKTLRAELNANILKREL